MKNFCPKIALHKNDKKRKKSYFKTWQNIGFIKQTENLFWDKTI